MRARASRDGLTLRVIAGTNNALLALDLSDAKRKDCLGFTIERTDLDTGERRWIPNMLRFPSDKIESGDLGPKVAVGATKPNAAAAVKPAAEAAKQVAKVRKAKGQPDTVSPPASSARAPLADVPLGRLHPRSRQALSLQGGGPLRFGGRRSRAGKGRRSPA